MESFAATCAAQIKPSLCSSPRIALDILCRALESRDESLAALIPECIEALVENREAVFKEFSPKQLSDKLKDHPHYYHAIVDTISPSTSPTTDTPSPLTASSHSISHPGLSAYAVPSPRVKLTLGEDMERLFDSGKESDFSIGLDDGDTSVSFPCHAAILYASWVYFRHMWEAGMREKNERTLRLPGPSHPDGITVGALKQVLRYAYTGRTPRQNVDPYDALYLLGRAELYGLASGDKRRRSHSLEPIGIPTQPDSALLALPTPTTTDHLQDEPDLSYKPLLDFCLAMIEKSLTTGNCVQLYKHAVDLGAYDAAGKARQFVVQNLKHILKTPNGKYQLLQLPQAELNLLMFDYISEH